MKPNKSKRKGYLKEQNGLPLKEIYKQFHVVLEELEKLHHQVVLFEIGLNIGKVTLKK